MASSGNEQKARTAPIFRQQSELARQSQPLSSSPAFATPVHPTRSAAPAHTILPIILPPSTLRPVAFRIFTKKNGLTLTSSALQTLSTFIGRHCGTEWRESGLAEPVLEEISKSWKNRNGNVIVDGANNDFKEILKYLEACMIGGRVVSREISRQNSFVLEKPLDSHIGQNHLNNKLEGDRNGNNVLSIMSSSSSDPNDQENREILRDPRNWLKVIDAFDQPRLVYNPSKKQFDRETTKQTLFPNASYKTQLFRNRYNLIHQRLLRNESFQKPSFDTSNHTSNGPHSGLETPQQFYKITPINNLLGRNGTNHLILGLLSISPTDTLTINDLSGSIALDLTHAKPIPENGAWFTPGMIVLVDGTYIEEDINTGTELGGGGGIGGCIGGKFIGFFVGGPPCERRKITLGINLTEKKECGNVVEGEFGWVDFLGVGSERAVGSKMRKIEQKVLKLSSFDETSNGRGRIVIFGEVNLDQPKTFQALKKVLGLYASDPEEHSPMAFVFMGNFSQHAVMARGSSSGSIEYKEGFDSLASTLSEYPTLLQNGTFIFVPGDNDGWTSAFGASAATTLPRKGVPEIFTSRIKRAFVIANAEAEKKYGRKTNGDAIWTSNPVRLSLFGPTHEIVFLRDDMSSRFRRSAIHFSSCQADDKVGVVDSNIIPLASSPSEPCTIRSSDGLLSTSNKHMIDSLYNTRKLVKPLLDQGYLSPFPLAQRPVHWKYASALQIYPLPTALVLADADSLAFVITYEECCVMNPGRLLLVERKSMAGWLEYDARTRKSKVRELQF
ncbi:DNA polymerase epsilon subunit B [Golovinomyces cichoracearum]|uniref:DNA polymerase epsilon subunit B n=1 Tax=Golovinomyces cichoracearum TaxID=62708 RepID=A0A420IAT6_9PEZI|nr:DNA polymerase epsilon subunit B [Golovinomyces cichoracearum]